jgi:integrase/recombinase XerC
MVSIMAVYLTIRAYTMSTELTIRPTSKAGDLPAIPTYADILDSWVASKKPETVDAYLLDATDFARFMKAPDIQTALEKLVAAGHGTANALVMAYKGDMTDNRKLSSATVARRLSALRSLIKVARTFGRITWSLDIDSPRVTAYRDTRGPGRDGYFRIEKAAARPSKADPEGKIAKRDLALVTLMHDLALRRGEAIAMDLADIDLDAGENSEGQIRIIGKGKREKETLSIGSLPAKEALRDWIEARGDEPGPLFCRLDRAADPAAGLQRLSGDAVCLMVRRLSRRAGLKKETRPHGLRHQAITRALDLTNGNAREVRKFSRHAKLETVMRYDDNREDVAGDISRKLGRDR